MDQAVGGLAHAMSDLERGFHEWACFSAQQAAEKALKAVFQRLGAEAWGHSVADPLEELGKVYGGDEDLVDGGMELDKAYISARYPHAHPSGSPRRRYTAVEARRPSGHARRVIEFCRGFLPRDESDRGDPEAA